MIKDIEFLKVENIKVAIIPEVSADGQGFFSTYLINLKEEDLSNVLVRSKGVGQINGQTVETSVLTTLIENLESQTYQKVDSFEAEAAGLSNEYWISFKHKGYLYDKKYVFVPESLVNENYINIPLLNLDGVMIG